ncbi:MAG: sigma-54-dependent transcriptional regulator [Puniceicoccaceae bacterium]
MADLKDQKILIIDDDDEIRYSLNRVLSSRGYMTAEASSGEAGIECAKAASYQVIFLDNRMEGMNGLETLQHLRTVSPDAMVILMTAFGTTQTAIEAMKFGAFDYIVKPFDLKKVLELTEKAAQSHSDLKKSQQQYAPVLDSDDYKEGIVGSSEAMRDVFKSIGQVATSNVTVMVTGESGTGKELVARCIHQHSLRSVKPFMAVNCAAIPDNLIESELFGHEKGAFTGATQQRLGKFELCDGGTLFLDEIGDMALPTQTKILRALQEGEIQRVGSEKTVKVDVRLIAATNRDLEKMVEDKSFREDLYYRLNVMRIRIPSLRDRLTDVPELVEFMLQRLLKEHKSIVQRVSSEAMSVLSNYSWPGNVRELENAIQRSVVIAQGETILKNDLPKELLNAVEARKPAEGSVVAEETSEAQSVEAVSAGESVELELDQAPAAQSISTEQMLDMVYARIRESVDSQLLENIDREMTRRALKEMGGNQVKTSALLGITRSTLRKRIEMYGLKAD